MCPGRKQEDQKCLKHRSQCRARRGLRLGSLVEPTPHRALTCLEASRALPSPKWEAIMEFNRWLWCYIIGRWVDHMIRYGFWEDHFDAEWRRDWARMAGLKQGREQGSIWGGWLGNSCSSAERLWRLYLGLVTSKGVGTSGWIWERFRRKTQRAWKQRPWKHGEWRCFKLFWVCPVSPICKLKMGALSRNHRTELT